MRVPLGSRYIAMYKLSSMIERVVKINNEGAWCDFFKFIFLLHLEFNFNYFNSSFTSGTPFPPPRVRTLKHHAADPLINLESRIC